MRSVLALGFLITLCGAANAATMHHAHRRHAVAGPHQGVIASDPALGFAYAPSGPPTQFRSVPDNDYNEPYLGANQGYAPGEYNRFLDSVRKGG